MTPEAQRIAIAEACGFVPSKKGDWWHTPEGNQLFLSELPDYPNDLNAMHEAEKVFDLNENFADSPRYKYAFTLYRICPAQFQPMRATASQRAEAFLRTIGKWVEQ